MIQDEPPILRILIISINSLTIIASTLILITFRTFPRLQETTGKLISIATTLETLFSILIMLSQFYTPFAPTPTLAMHIKQEGIVCSILGFIDLILFFFYFFLVDIYCLYLNHLFNRNLFIKNLDKAFKAEFLNKVILILVLLSICLAIGAIFTDSIGYSDIGICSNDSNRDMELNIFLVTLLIVSFGLSVFTLIKIILNRDQKIVGVYQTDAVKFQRKFQKKFVETNVYYLLAFNFTRILPVILMVFSQIYYRHNDFESLAYYKYPTLVLISSGGLILSLVRLREPIVLKYILIRFNLNKRKQENYKSGSIQLPQLGQLSNPSKVFDGDLTESNGNSSLSTQRQTGDNRQSEVSIAMFRQTTAKQSLLSATNIFSDTDIQTSQLQLQARNLQDFRLIFYCLYKLNQKEMKNSISSLQASKQTKCRIFDIKHITQRRYLCEEFQPLIQSDALDDEAEEQYLKALDQLEEIPTYERIFKQSILCTTYSSTYFNFMRNSAQSMVYLSQSLNPLKNTQSLNELSIELLQSRYFSFITYDSNISISFISRNAKSYLLNVLLKEIMYLKSQPLFLPQIVGLYSFSNQKSNFTIVLQKTIVNVKELKEKYGVNLIGIYTFQNNEVSLQMKMNTLKQEEFVENIKLQQSSKDHFLELLNDFISFMIQQQIWGYSFSLMLFERPSHDLLKEYPGIFYTENQKYCLMGQVGNLFDQFYLKVDILEQINYRAIVNPELYALSLIDKMNSIL